MPLIIIAVLFIIGIAIYTSIKNKKEIQDTEKKLGDKLFDLFEMLIKKLRNNGASFTVEDDDDYNPANEKEEDKVLFFPNKNKDENE
ncbi:MAG: hypothetical protein KBS56_01170 [Clostridiales bacterium]|nr:hypothetical protein [Candidatus Crickella equi]